MVLSRDPRHQSPLPTRQTFTTARETVQRFLYYSREHHMMGGYGPGRSAGGLPPLRGLSREVKTPSGVITVERRLIFTTGNQVSPPLPNTAVPNQGKRGNRSPRAPKREPYPFPVFPKRKPLPSPSRRGSYLNIRRYSPWHPRTRAPPFPVPTRPLDLLLHRRGAPAHPSRPITGRTLPRGRAARVVATFLARPLPQFRPESRA